MWQIFKDPRNDEETRQGDGQKHYRSDPNKLPNLSIHQKQDRRGKMKHVIVYLVWLIAEVSHSPVPQDSSWVAYSPSSDSSWLIVGLYVGFENCSKFWKPVSSALPTLSYHQQQEFNLFYPPQTVSASPHPIRSLLDCCKVLQLRIVVPLWNDYPLLPYVGTMVLFVRRSDQIKPD